MSNEPRIVCFSHDERKVLISVDGSKTGRHEWKNVEYENDGRGYAYVNGNKVFVFA